MAFNLGRPAMLGGEETIRHCRNILNHPFSVQNDSRLVAMCELLSMRRGFMRFFCLSWRLLSFRVPSLIDCLARMTSFA